MNDPKPGNYTLGSVKSRAAARVMIKANKEEEMVIQIVYVGPNGERDLGEVIRIPAM